MNAVESWDMSCPDWWPRLQAGRSIMPALPLDRTEAERAAQTFDRFRIPDVVGQPTLGEAAGDWFRDLVRAIFGSMLDGMRMVHDTVVLVPKKNSKTTNSAALMLTALVLNKRPLPRFGLFGPTQNVSNLAFTAAAGMVAADEHMAKLLHVQEHVKTITHRVTGAILKVTTFDPSVATGGIYSGWLLDELHLLGSVPYAERVIAQLRGARIAIPESFGVIITTQSDVQPAGIFKAELKRARAVRDGREESRGVLPLLYEFPETLQTGKGQPWLDPDLWPIINPNWGRSVNGQVLASLHDDARDLGPVAVQIWASQHLNIEIGLGLHDERWRGADHWEGATDRTLTLDELLRRCEVATIGIDGGGLDDLLGLAVIGREKRTRRWLHWGKAWADTGVKEIRKEIAARLEDFEKAGDLEFVDIAPPVSDEEADREAPVSDDIAGVVDIVQKVHAAGLLPPTDGVGLDPVGVAAIVDALVKAEIPPDTICGVPQGYRLSGIIAGVARKLKDRSFRHGGQDLMAWCVSNAKAELKGSALLVTKQQAGKAKIDPLIALFNAADLMSKNPDAAGGSLDDYLESMKGAA